MMSQIKPVIRVQAVEIQRKPEQIITAVVGAEDYFGAAAENGFPAALKSFLLRAFHIQF